MLERRFAVPWGKYSIDSCHHLAHHCADVSACFEAIIQLPAIQDRLARAAGRTLTRQDNSRLAVLSFLHDAGKLHPGFQAKGWPSGLWRRATVGHLAAGLAIFQPGPTEAIAGHLRVKDLAKWGMSGDLLHCLLAHHGRPIHPPANDPAFRYWDPVPDAGYDPCAAAADIGMLLPDWFSEAFSPSESTLPDTPPFHHLLCGLISLADWLGSNANTFAFVSKLDPGYMKTARSIADRLITTTGINPTRWQVVAAGKSGFSDVTGLERPRPQQQLVGRLSHDARLAILEAETGSGKTEAALWRFVQLFGGGLVDSLYFALPTRSAAVQIQHRVNEAMTRVFGEGALEAILAVPGYIRSGDTDGQPMADWQVRWDDDGGVDEARLQARWAAESSKRFLAAPVAVGTVDQAMLAGLQVRHAHLRAAALTRSLLVIDEVHASDAYMTEVQAALLRNHLGYGGHALLMSATLGSAARAKWLGHESVPTFEQALQAPYPALWNEVSATPAHADASQDQKTVRMDLFAPWSAQNAAKRAISTAERGARVLVIRNTVDEAIATWQAVIDVGASDLLLQAGGGPALHHGRFATEDRKLLDGIVTDALSPDMQKRAAQGIIVVGTQTLEQSLDIDADLLITDLCPADVLLQRIGRLHRHAGLARPAGFDEARCIVLVPESGLAPLIARFENGLGLFRDGGGIYPDLSICELTQRLVGDCPDWTLPDMNRFLVESATHPNKIAALHAELGPAWAEQHNAILGGKMADRGAARRVGLPVHTPFAQVRFASEEEYVRTRLGAEGARVEFAEPAMGPFGSEITGVTLPAHWSKGVDTSEFVSVDTAKHSLSFSVDSRRFVYTRSGLRRGEA